MDKYSKEWCDKKKKTCKNCALTFYYCKRHTPKVISKSSRTWAGMSHQESCSLLQKLNNKNKEAIEIYIKELKKQSIKKDFKSWEIKCPNCKGYDIHTRKGYV